MITCGWCGTKYINFQTNCKNCGGLLPVPPGMDAGPPPPEAPRRLPKGFERKVLWTGNVFAIIGAIFLLVGLPLVVAMFFVHPLAPLIPAVHATLGFLLFRHGRGKGQRTLNAFKNGRAVQGRITEIRKDTTTTVNNRHPWLIEYQFAVDNQAIDGSITTWDSTAQDRRRGQPIWILYVESDPEQNTIYPPVK